MLKIKAKNFGRIAQADVQLAPLLILVGKNNTGKSYLATLLWAIGELDLLTDFSTRMRRPPWFAGFVKPFSEPNERHLQVDEGKVTELVAFINRIFANRGAAFLEKVFAATGFDKTQISISQDYVTPFDVFLRVSGKSKAKNADGPMLDLIFKSEGLEHHSFTIPARYFSDDGWLGSFIFDQVLGFALFGLNWRMMSNSTYIPAARTGIMLALPALVSEAIVADQAPRVPMPVPLTYFLRTMARPRPSIRGVKSENETSARQQLKRRLICGQIASIGDSTADYRYIPEGMQIRLPLHATSSMITELAPIQVALDNNPNKQYLVFEEPEAHLHLEAQREMAKLIARLIKSGFWVTLTTHSDTFLQQINNLMVLHDHPNRLELMEQFGYHDDDLINPQLTKAYEFCTEDAGTFVQEVEKTNEGFVVSSLNNTLLALARETFALRGDVDA